MQVERVLKNELDIGVSLNKATASSHRSDFSLILSLMSQDVRDMAQFELNDKDNLRSHFELPEAQFELNDKDNLRSHFELPEDVPSEVNLSEGNEFNEHSDVFRNQNHTEFRLHQSLKPEPLVCRGSVSKAIQQALDNCDIHTINRYKQVEPKTNQTQKVAFIDQLQQQRTMAKLIECA